MSTSRTAIVTVINDLYSDRRVDKTCIELMRAGFTVNLVGRQLPDSPPIPQRPYRCYRLPMVFRQGMLMYLEFQFRLFLWIMVRKGHFFWSNDLDTVLPCFIAARLRRVPVFQDSHEYFTGVPELKGKPLKRKIWKFLERLTYRRVDELITVNDSIASILSRQYKRSVHVIRNIPPSPPPIELQSRSQLGLPEEKDILLMQGAGINMERGAEELVQAMEYISHAVLMIIGSGDVIPPLKEYVRSKEALRNKVFFLDRMPYQQLYHYTCHARLGFSLDKPLSENYRLSLPNKLFDYIHAHTPVVVSDIHEVGKIVEHYNIGMVTPTTDPHELANVILAALDNRERYAKWKENLTFAASRLTWENERKVLTQLLQSYAG